MTGLELILVVLAALFAVAMMAGLRVVRGRNLQNWLGAYLRESARPRFSRTQRDRGPVDILLCIADHFEPGWGDPTREIADQRVAEWVREYPRLIGEFRDSDGRPPRHTFFYPIDQYEPRHVEAIAQLCREGYGEVEIHLHHDGDTAANLERTLHRYTQLFADEHGLLGRWPDGRIAYGFVHGNWALDNSRPDGRWCGVDNELEVLRRTGCYADFTFPSAPDATQPQKINSIYYAVGQPGRCKSHDRGVDVGIGLPPPDGFMLIQGPLRLWRPRGTWRPRIENGCIQRGQPPTLERLEQWMRANVHVPARPDWLFVKLHTHGAIEQNRRVLLGEPMTHFHRALVERAARDSRFRFHYVTAREMYNLAKAAEHGWKGSVQSALDFAVAPPGPRTVACSTHAE
jgi:hypothetical protein